MSKVVVATTVAPLVAAVGLQLLVIFGPNRTSREPVDILIGTVVGYVLALLLTACIVLLLRFFWRRWVVRSWVAMGIGALAGAALLAIAAFAYSRVPIFGPNHVPLGSYLGLGLIGALTGLVFWLIAHAEMRPNTSLERTRAR
jgi:hypothetical protein